MPTLPTAPTTREVSRATGFSYTTRAAQVLADFFAALVSGWGTRPVATPVLGVLVTAQPVGPVEGDVYLLGAAGPYTGAAWSAFAQGEIAEYESGAWTSRVPEVGELFSYTDGASPPVSQLYAVTASGGFAYETLTTL